MKRFSIPVLSLLAAAILAGCSGGSSSGLLQTPDDPVAAGMAEVALQADLLTEAVLSAEVDATESLAKSGDEGTEPVTVERSFSRTRSCPAGGEMGVEGRLVLTYDRETSVMEAESSGSRSRAGCAFVRDDGVTVTIDGSASWESFRRRVEGRPDGPQTRSYSGSWTAVTSDGEERFCEFDYTVVRDPDAGTRTVEGTMCGRRVRSAAVWQAAG